MQKIALEAFDGRTIHADDRGLHRFERTHAGRDRRIAEDTDLPEIIAVELGCYLVHSASGRERIKALIRDDIELARARGDYRHAAKLKLVLKHFIAEQKLALSTARPAAGSAAASGA